MFSKCSPGSSPAVAHYKASSAIAFGHHAFCRGRLRKSCAILLKQTLRRVHRMQRHQHNLGAQTSAAETTSRQTRRTSRSMKTSHTRHPSDSVASRWRCPLVCQQQTSKLLSHHHSHHHSLSRCRIHLHHRQPPTITIRAMVPHQVHQNKTWTGRLTTTASSLRQFWRSFSYQSECGTTVLED